MSFSHFKKIINTACLKINSQIFLFTISSFSFMFGFTSIILTFFTMGMTSSKKYFERDRQPLTDVPYYGGIMLYV